MVTFCGQAVNGHGEGPLSDIVVGQTTESGEEQSSYKIWMEGEENHTEFWDPKEFVCSMRSENL